MKPIKQTSMNSNDEEECDFKSSDEEESSLDDEENEEVDVDVDDEEKEEEEDVDNQREDDEDEDNIDHDDIVDTNKDRVDDKSPRKRKKSTRSLIEHDQTDEKNTSRSLVQILLIAFIIIIAFGASLLYNNGVNNKLEDKSEPSNEVRINFEQVEQLNNHYPGLLSPKEMRIIKTRIAVMAQEVSILMLLGKSRDSHCKLDPTFCVGQTIANVTQLQYGYIDASDPYLNSNEIKRELGKALDSYKNSVIVDSLEQLPGTEVMNLFQFIDKDETHKRRGMLILIVYTGFRSEQESVKLKEAELAETVLLERWSEFIPKDSLTSVLSRMCGSIVKVY